MANSEFEEDFQVIVADIERLQKKASEAKYLEAQKELANNVYPLLAELVRAVDERLARTETVVVDLIEDSDSVIQPELAAQIYGCIELGQQLCDAVDAAQVDDVTKARLAEIAQAYRIAANIVIREVAEVAIEPDDAEDEDDEDEDEDDSDDDLDEDDEDSGSDSTEDEAE